MRIFQIGEYHGHIIHEHRVGDVHFAMTRRARGETVPEHLHNHAAIRSLISGDHHYIDPEGNIRNSLPSAWYYSEPNAVHSHEACQTDIVSVGIQFHAEQFPTPVISANTVLRGTTANFVFSLFESHLRDPRPTSPDVLMSVFHLLRATLADEGQQSTTNIPSWLNRLKQHLDSHFLQPLNVDHLSQEIGIHPSHMARAFRAEFGQTVTTYVRDRRLEWSLDTMKNSDDKLGKIAIQAGFADQAHFSREFKRRYGHAPSVYR